MKAPTVEIVLVEAGRFARLQRAAMCHVDMWRVECDGDWDCAWGNAGIGTRDIEPEVLHEWSAHWEKVPTGEDE